MGKTSDTKGKAFEFILCETLCKRLKLYGYTVNLTQDFTECQKTDSFKFASLLPQEIKYFTSQSELTSDWFIHLLSSLHTKNVTLNRLPDSKGTKGNPTDIEIITSLKQINISAILLASVVSALTIQLLIGSELSLRLGDFDLKNPLLELPLYLLLGSMSGVVAAIFSGVAQYSKSVFDGEEG